MGGGQRSRIWRHDERHRAPRSRVASPADASGVLARAPRTCRSTFRISARSLLCHSRTMSLGSFFLNIPKRPMVRGRGRAPESGGNNWRVRSDVRDFASGLLLECLEDTPRGLIEARAKGLVVASVKMSGTPGVVAAQKVRVAPALEPGARRVAARRASARADGRARTLKRSAPSSRPASRDAIADARPRSLVLASSSRRSRLPRASST